jgi:hypothetical protein
MKKIKQNNLYQFAQNFIKWVLIPFLLIALWICLSLVFGSYKSFSVLQYPHYNDVKNEFSQKKLLKGDHLLGDFVAKDNNLGIISVRFGDVPRVEYKDEDVIIFRIREVGSNKWLFTNKYRSGAFSSNEYFPFGFNIIKHSKNKEYFFEILSTKGNNINAIQTKSSSPSYLTKYKYESGFLLKNMNFLMRFIWEKLYTFVTNFESLLSSTVFLLPLVFYMCWNLLPVKKWTEDKKILSIKNLLVLFTVSLIVYNLVFYEFYNYGFMICLLGLWFGVCFFLKLKSSKTLALAFIILAISTVSASLHLRVSVDKESSFAYFLIVFGFLQSLSEYKASDSSKPYFKKGNSKTVK